MEGFEARELGLRTALVSRRCVADNLALLARTTSGELIADLSADAFGHGLVEASRAVVEAGVSIVAVRRTDDAVRLRDAGYRSDLVVWAPAPGDDLELATSLGLGIGVSSIPAFDEAGARAAGSLWLVVGEAPGVETLGARDLTTVLRRIAARSDDPAGIALCLAGGSATHLTTAIEIAASEAVHVVAVAAPPEALHTLPNVTSTGTRVFACVGAEIFGVSESLRPEPGSTRPALRLLSPIIALKHAVADVGVSYGYTYRTTRDTVIALVPVGYGDGIDRAAGNVAEVSLSGTRYTIAGRVAMDASVLDVGAAEVGIGDVVEFFGDPATGAPTAHDWGIALGVPSAAITAGLTSRVERRWV